MVTSLANRPALSNAASQLERLVDANRRLTEQTYQRSEQNRERLNSAVNTMLDSQIDLQQKKAHVGQVLLDSGVAGSIIDIRA